jgi:ubiquinone/menaquinone biosynthesis C-methylase UbiE
MVRTKKGSWDVVAKKYNESVKDEGHINHQIYLNPLVLKLLGNVKNKKILDLACGNGYFSGKLENKGAIVTGVDYSGELLKIANSKKKKNSKMRFFEGSSNNMKFLKSNSFDMIVSNIAFMDIKNINGTINECSRVLKKGGKFVFSLTHPAFINYEKKKLEKNCYGKLRKYMTPFEKEHKHFSGVKVYHRPIEYYMKSLFDNGFVVTGFFEIATRHSKGKVIKNKKLANLKEEIPTFSKFSRFFK